MIVSKLRKFRIVNIRALKRKEKKKLMENSTNIMYSYNYRKVTDF